MLATHAAPSRVAIPRGSTPDFTVAVTCPEAVSMLETEAPRLFATHSVVPASASPSGPLRSGSAVIHLTLAHADRVTVKIYDVSGRLVRTLADGQMFKAGKVDPALTWDGLDNAGRRVARGAYFVGVRYEKSGYKASPKMIVLR